MLFIELHKEFPLKVRDDYIKNNRKIAKIIHISECIICKSIIQRKKRKFFSDILQTVENYRIQ